MREGEGERRRGEGREWGGKEGRRKGGTEFDEGEGGETYSNFVRQSYMCSGQEVMLILLCGLNVPSVCSDDIPPQACPTPGGTERHASYQL